MAAWVQKELMTLIYKGLREFYDARGGTFSEESEYGGHHWIDRIGGPLSPVVVIPGFTVIDGKVEFIVRPAAMRVGFVHDTGDLYAVLQGKTLEEEDGPVLLLGTVAGEPDEVDSFMGDWKDSEHLGRPLSWFTDRIAAFEGGLREHPHS